MEVGPGQMLSQYRLVEKVGAGGMGVVWRAHDSRLDRPVALKLLKPEYVGDEKHRQRFLREARSAAAVTHPYIAAIYDADETDGTLFIAMEFVEGRTLRALLHEGPLPVQEAQRYATEIAEGLAKAHQAQIIHRDLKPDNVIVSSDGHTKILDFGLAKLIEKRDEATTLSLAATARPEETTKGTILGTPAYMSPEQARGEEVDTRSDVFSFGSTLFEMLTGKSCFRGPTHQDSVASILRDQPAPASQLNDGISSDLDRIINRCLRKNPDERYNDTRDLVAALKDSQSSSESQQVSSPIPAPRPRKRRRTIVTASTVLVAVAVLAWFWPRESDKTSEEQAVSSGGSGSESSDQIDVSRDPVPPLTPNWILVADFDGPPEEPDLAVAAQQLVIASLAQSKLVTPIPRSELDRALRTAMKPDTTRLRGEVAREMALRAAARTYVEGRIDRVIRGFSLVLSVKDAESGHILHSLHDTAENEDVLVTKLDNIARSLREKLGEQPDSVRRTMKSWEVMTPSFAAFLKYVEANESINDSRSRDAIVAAREALALDSDFAAAWFRLGMAYANVGHRDSCAMMYREALDRPDRLSEAQRLAVQALLHLNDGKYDEGLKILDRLVRQNPLDHENYNYRGVTLALLGRTEEAVADHERNAELFPFAAPSLVYRNRFYQLLLLEDRHEEAERLIERLSERHRNRARLYLALAKSDWARAESLATASVNDPAGNRVAPLWSGVVLAVLAAKTGQLRAAAAEMERLAHESPSFQDEFDFTRFELATLNPEIPIRFDAREDTTTATLIIDGIQAAFAGDLVTARTNLNRIADMPVMDQRRYASDILLLEGWIAFADSAWGEVIRILKPTTQAGQIPRFTGRVPTRWLVAEAYEAQRQFGEAAEYFESVLLPQGITIDDLVLRALWQIRAHHRLVLLYSKMGQVEDARRHWEVFEQTFTNPDPELVPMIDEARQALAVAEASL